MEIQQLLGFAAVAKTKSFSQAAKIVFRTQSAVSLQVQALEEELGVLLFDRLSPRKTELTADGVQLLELAQPLLEDFKTLREKFEEKKGEPSKMEIRIATHEPVIAHLLPGPIECFKKKYPQVKFTLSRKERSGIIEAVMAGEVHLGISALKQPHPSLDYHVIEKHDRVLVTPKNHPLAGKNKITPEQIAKYPLLLPPKGTNTRDIIEKVFKDRGLEVNLAMEATGREAIKSYISLGFGISILNERFIAKEDKKKFFTANVARYFGQSERGVLTLKRKQLPKYVSEFIELLGRK
ncbi:MAG: LysR family transcriptional regulator [Deltaproteobacteria bacterium]|nr:LysR family transcriptional regulator [Deltaproteobacteria bacterium]